MAIESAPATEDPLGGVPGAGGADDEAKVVVVGAGPAGISAAAALKDAGLRPVVVDRSEEVISSWRGRYDRLRLNTWRRFSHPPGRPYPPGTPTFPSRDDVVEHFAGIADEDGIELRLGTPVERIDRDGAGWVVRVPGGGVRTSQVVIATGFEQEPVIPGWPGREDFRGRLLHAAQYRNPDPFQGQDVLVVGPGCSGMEIAQDLLEGGAARVRISVRTPPNILLRQGPGALPGDVIAVALWHLPTRVADAVASFGRRMDVGDLAEYGLPVPEEGVFTRTRRIGAVPAIVDKPVIDAIKERRIEVVAAVASLDERAVTLADGTRLEPDSVICATGYRRALEPLVGHLGVLGERGVPRGLGRDAPALGLWFVGYVPRPGGLGYMGKEARRVARAIARDLRRNQRAKETG